MKRTSVNEMVRGFLTRLVADEQSKDEAREALLKLIDESEGRGGEGWPASPGLIANSDVFLDTNVLLYAALGRDHAGHRWERAREIVLTEDYCTSGQVLAEFYNNAIRKSATPLSPDKAREWVRVVAMKPCQPITPEVVVAVIDNARRYQLSYWDGAIVAAAERLGAK
ncbi:hypothetical protein LTR94_030892, partial [Friedmanniomyces endolithicus]